MGRASSNKKVQRAARAAGRPGAGRNLTWPLTIGGVVVVGVLLIVFTVAGPNKDAAAPKIGDHWHAAYGLYNCNSFIPPLQDEKSDTTGLHTHDDGLIHMHPFATKYTGSGANLENWGKTVGMAITDTRVDARGMTVENGDKCDGKPGKVVLKVWDDPTDTKGHIIKKDIGKFAPQNFNLVTIAFVADGTDVPRPPDAAIAALQAPSDLTGAEPSTVPTTQLPLEATSTTAPAPSPSSTTATSTP